MKLESWILILAVVASCRNETRESTSPPPSVEVLHSVPDVDQSTDYSCGPSALQAVLGHYGAWVDEKTLIQEANTDPDSGAEPENLAAAAAKYGVRGEPRENLTLDELAREIAAGHPVMTLIQAWRTSSTKSWKDEWDDGHYVVVIGIDETTVYVEDPSLVGSRGTIPRDEFVDRWHCWNSKDEKAWGQGIFFRRESPPPVKWSVVK